MTFADVVKNNVFMSKKDKNTPLVAVQGRSQQRKPPELVKEVSGKTQMAHLIMERKDRFVKKPVVAGSPYDSIPCFNKFDPLVDIQEEYCEDSIEIVNQYIADDDCSFAARGTGVDDLVDPFTTFDKKDKFDTLLVKKKMDYDTISQVKASKDYKACKNKMGEPFGVIPLSPLLVYTGPNTSNNQVSDPLLAHKLVRQSGCPNFGGSRIPVDSKLNIKNWRFYLHDFWDKPLVDLLEHGFPLDFDRGAPLLSTEQNHASAKNFACDVQTYISDELKHGAMLDPFKTKLKDQGTWSSDYVYTYVSSDTQFSSSPFSALSNSTYSLDRCLGEPFFYQILKQLILVTFWRFK